MVEIVGVVGIVASMILVAAELRTANEVASTEAELSLAEQYNVFLRQRASNPEIAKIFPKLESPDAHLITATDDSQIRGIAAYQINFLQAVQNAYTGDLISRKVRDAYIADFARTIDEWPGIRPYYVEIYESREALHGQIEFAPLAEYIAAQGNVEAAE
jgi:hypothetical protein